MSEPIVSVLMAVRDGASYLPATLQSLRALRAPEGGIEFVVVDDASTDATPALLAAWAREEPRVRLVTASRPLGLPAALNAGLERVRAPLVARADADDLYAPERLLRQATAFTRDPELGLLSCGYERIGPDGATISRVVPLTGPDTLRFRMLLMNPLLHSGAMFRTELVRAAGGYDTAYWTAQDSDLWARLAERTRVDNLPETLVSYRVHPASVMKRRGAAGQALSLTVPTRLQRAYLGELPPDHDVAATVRLFQGFEPMDAKALRAGLDGLERLHRAAQGRETAPALASFTAQATRSMLRHARWTRRRAPRTAFALLSRAVRWRLERQPRPHIVPPAGYRA